jgi:hypothetical protein
MRLSRESVFNAKGAATHQQAWGNAPGNGRKKTQRSKRDSFQAHQSILSLSCVAPRFQRPFTNMTESLGRCPRLA